MSITISSVIHAVQAAPGFYVAAGLTMITLLGSGVCGLLLTRKPKADRAP